MGIPGSLISIQLAMKAEMTIGKVSIILVIGSFVNELHLRNIDVCSVSGAEYFRCSKGRRKADDVVDVVDVEAFQSGTSS